MSAYGKSKEKRKYHKTSFPALKGNKVAYELKNICNLSGTANNSSLVFLLEAFLMKKRKEERK